MPKLEKQSSHSRSAIPRGGTSLVLSREEANKFCPRVSQRLSSALGQFRMKKALLLLSLLGVAAGGGYFGWNKWQVAKSTSAVPSRPTTAPVEMRDIHFAVN